MSESMPKPTENPNALGNDPAPADPVGNADLESMMDAANMANEIWQCLDELKGLVALATGQRRENVLILESAAAGSIPSGWLIHLAGVCRSSVVRSEAQLAAFLHACTPFREPDQATPQSIAPDSKQAEMSFAEAAMKGGWE